MLVLDEVAFCRIDLRLARFLVAHGGADDSVHLSHQELAVELGTAREVVSRQLKEFERRGWVRLDRRRIVVCDAPELRALARGEAHGFGDRITDRGPASMP
jgi:CRP/FNR family transcriptional regulator